MNLYLIKQTTNQDYDTYDSAVVCAPDEETARNMDPCIGKPVDWNNPWNSWCSSPDQVSVKLLGVADEKIQGVVCASFNAG